MASGGGGGMGSTHRRGGWCGGGQYVCSWHRYDAGWSRRVDARRDARQEGQASPHSTRLDPYSNFQPQLGAIENMLGGQAGCLHQVSGPGAVGNLFVAPGQQQTGALGALEDWYKQATPAFGAGLRGVEETVGGKYLDPMERPEFRRLAEARQNIATATVRGRAGQHRIRRHRHRGREPVQFFRHASADDARRWAPLQPGRPGHRPGWLGSIWRGARAPRCGHAASPWYWRRGSLVRCSVRRGATPGSRAGGGDRAGRTQHAGQIAAMEGQLRGDGAGSGRD